jgi:hypothetical protein
MSHVIRSEVLGNRYTKITLYKPFKYFFIREGPDESHGITATDTHNSLSVIITSNQEG